MKVRTTLLSTLLVAALLGGCSAMPSAADVPPLDGTAWRLSSMPGRTWSGAPATANFEGGRVQGSDGCNRYSAPFPAQGATFEVGSRGVSTMMACPPETMKQAEAYMAALGGAKSYRVVNGQLELLAANGSVLVTLAPQSRSLAGTAWQVTGINNGRQALVSLLGTTTVTMAFTADGGVAGYAGCNQYTARTEADGARFRFVAPATTRRMCPGAGVMEQEQQFLKALEAVTTMRVEGDRLEFRDGTGALQVTAKREGASRT
jgi:heat shock protein HslJ